MRVPRTVAEILAAAKADREDRRRRRARAPEPWKGSLSNTERAREIIEDVRADESRDWDEIDRQAQGDRE